MVTEVERLVIRLEASQAKFEKQMARANRVANRSARGIETRFGRMNKNLSRGAVRLGGALAAAFASRAALRSATRLVDSATRIENALKVAGLAGDDLKKVYDRLFESAQRNAAPVEALTELYSRAALVQKDLGVSTEELLGFTDRVALALRVSGKSAEQSAGALLQLSQALGSGTVRAEEFNSILEGALPIAQAAAAGLDEAGGSVARLRKLIADGAVSSEAFFRAFEAGSVILEDKVAGAALTTSQATTLLNNALTKAAGRFDDATGASQSFANSISALAEVINNIDFAPLFSQIDALEQRLAVFGNSGVFKGINEFFGLTSDENLRAAGLTPIGDAVQSRIDDAFGNQIAGGKTGRIKRAAPKPVSLSDFKPPSGGSGGRSSRARQNAFQREIQQIRERTAAIEKMTRAQATVNPLIDDFGFSLEQARAAAELETAARRAGIEITPQLRAQIQELSAAYATATSTAEQLAFEQDNVRETAEELKAVSKDVLGGFISDLRWGKSATEAFAGALDRMADKLLDIAANNFFDTGGGGFLGSLFGGGGGGGLLGGFLIPGILHKGGVAGRDGYGHGRAVSPSVFAGAPRMHSGGVAGLRSGEVPAILQKGEVVIPNGMKAAPSGPGNVNINVHVDGANGDSHVIALVRQGVAQGIGEYDRTLSRGFGSRMAEAQGREL